MANLLWGNVYYKNIFAGVLKEEPGERVIFQYDPSYLNSACPAISYTFPLSTTPYVSEKGLHPFFDNLVAEGWLEHAQTRLLGKRHLSRFELLLAFGYDCAGAVSIIDPDPTRLTDQLLDMNDPREIAVLTSRASLSGVQPKLAIVERNGQYYSAKANEISTHIAKFSSTEHPDLIINEYLTTQAFKALLPDNDTVELTIDTIDGISQEALIIKRFDRINDERLHFEEFNQLLSYKAGDKYNGSYKQMSEFIRTNKACLKIENFRLFSQILAGILVGNTDMHFKNFALFHTPAGLRLTPSYDQVAASLYKYKTIALALGGITNIRINDIKPKHVIALASEFDLSKVALEMIVKQLSRTKEAAKNTVLESHLGNSNFKDKLIKLVDTRWNGTFALIGQTLSTKQ